MYQKKLVVILGVIAFVGVSIAATRPSPSKHKNLQILPKDISDEKLDSIMQTYSKALGVNCAFCHTPFDPKFPDSLNFALDDNHMKEEARKMMRLTIQLNKDYFYYDTLQRPEYLKVVTCFTCHRGDPFPADL
jgi:hypothetical protein